MPPLPQQFTPTQTFVPPLPPPFNTPPKLCAVEEVMKDHQGTDVNSLRLLQGRPSLARKSCKILAQAEKTEQVVLTKTSSRM